MKAHRVVQWSELLPLFILACVSGCGGRKSGSDHHASAGAASFASDSVGSSTMTTGSSPRSFGGGAAASLAHTSATGGSNADSMNGEGGADAQSEPGSGGRANSVSASVASGGAAMSQTTAEIRRGCGPLIDDMEAQTGFICEGDGRRGAWYSYNDQDPNASQWPERTTVPGIPIAVSGSDRTTNGHGMRTYGTNGAWSGIGLDLNFDGTTYGTFDASIYDGVSFWAKGSAFDFRVGTPETTLVKYGGVCTGDTCDYHPHLTSFPESAVWTQHTVLFHELSSWNDPGKFERDKLTNIQFEYRGYTDYDYTIDDVTFYVRPECCQGPLPRCQTLTIQDTALEQALRWTAARRNGPLLCKDLCDETVLSVGRDVRRLDGLDCLPQFTDVTVSDSPLERVAPLSKLEHLETLALTRDGLTDLTGLGPLPALRKLTLDNNQLVDLHPLEQLEGLEELSLCNNRIVDISPLSRLTQLTKLKLDGNAIVDLSALSSLVQLTNLSLTGNDVVDLSALSGLTKLEQLDLTLGDATEVTLPGDLQSLTGLTIRGGRASKLVISGGLSHLKNVTLSNCEIQELVMGAGLPALQWLLLSGNQLVRVAFQGGLPALESLDLGSNKLVSFALPEGFAGLTSLSVADNSLQQLALATGLAKLETLNLSQNRLVTLSLPSDLAELRSIDASRNLLTELPLNSGMTSLAELRLAENQIDSISIPPTLTQLTSVDLSKNQLDDVTGLTALTALRSLDLRDNEITDFAPLANANLPADGGSLWIAGNPFVCSEQLEHLRSISQRKVYLQAGDDCLP